MPPVCSEVNAPHHPRRYFGRTRDDGDGGGQIQRDSQHHSRHARLRAYLHRRDRKLRRRGIRRHFRTLALNIRRVVSKRRDGGAAETNCANGQYQKSENLREETFHKSTLGVRRENYASYSRHRR